MEMIGSFINLIVTGGYMFASGIFVKTGIQYVKDYKTSVANEKEIN